MNDLTILYYSANLVPQKFMNRIQEQIVKAAPDTEIISITQKPINFGRNICVGQIGVSSYNVYKQILLGAKNAITEYVAMAEDDALYPVDHFSYRPQGETFAYNVNKWSIFTWKKDPIMSYRERRTMVGLIVNRIALIRTLEERFKKYPDPNNIPAPYFGEPGRHENHLGITPLTNERFKSPTPILVFCHTESISFNSYLGSRKAHSKVRALEVAPWGKAEDLLKLYV